MLKKLGRRVIALSACLATVLVFSFCFLLQQANETFRSVRLEYEPFFSSLVRWEQFDYDLQLRWREPPLPSDKIIILGISEPSLKYFGRFPFSRTVYAEMLRRLRQAGVKVVALDMVFSESERTEGKEIALQTLRAQGEAKLAEQVSTAIEQQNGDIVFAKELQNETPAVVLGFIFNNIEVASTMSSPVSALYENSTIAYEDRAQVLRVCTADEPFLPVSVLSEAAASKQKLGSFNMAMDNDGVVRRLPALLRQANKLLPSLAVAAVAQYLHVTPKLLPQGEVIFGSSKVYMPVNAYGEIRPAYYWGASDYWKEKPFPTFELSDLFMEKIPPEKLAGKIVFLGATAKGLQDIRNLPLDPNAPGVDVHATLASNILEGHFITRNYSHLLFGLAVLVFGSLGLSLAALYTTPFLSLSLATALTLAVWLATYWTFSHGLWLPFILPCIGILVAYLGTVLTRFFKTDREKKFIKNAFSRYVSSAVVEQMLSQPEMLKLSGEKRELTVMFADVEGFTALSEKMDAKELSAILNEFFTAMTSIVHEHGGTLDKYMGDALMCFWGAPIASTEHAQQACNAALAMQERLQLCAQEWQKSHGFSLAMRIGLNTGEMAVGNMGSKEIFSYTVVGDAVNTASRLEAANKDYGTRILVGETTARSLQAQFVFRKVDEKSLRGRQQHSGLYELLGKRPLNQKLMDCLESYERALEHFLNGNLMAAKEGLRLVLALHPHDGPALQLQKRIESLKQAEHMQHAN